MSWNPEEFDPEWPFDLFATHFSLDPASTALLVIDMQIGQFAVKPDSIIAQRFPQIAQYMNQRIENEVLPNIQRLIQYFREQERKIVYTRNGNVTSTADEVTERIKAKKTNDDSGEVTSHHGTADYQIDSRLAPTDADLVIDKLTSGGFTASFLEHALRNMNIGTMVLTGVLTDACVFGTARSAAELGFNSLICEDACATYTQRAHEDALLMHARMFGEVDTAERVISKMA
jgi:nicotinamidase-related amidase